jgi:regulator of sigma E protease
VRLEVDPSGSAGEVRTIDATLRSSEEVIASRQTDQPKGYLGVGTYEYQVVRSTWSAPIVAGGLTLQFTKLTLAGIGNALWQLVSGNPSGASENVSGPIGIFVILRDGATLGFSYILLIIGLLSLTLAIMNALPIPALDGGRLAVMLGFRAFKKKLMPEVEERIHAIGFVTLLGLIVLISVVDVRRFF